jgi:hypothetical protein
MTKIAAYNNARKEFNEWFETKIKQTVAASVPDNPIPKNHIAYFREDLKAFIKNNPQFRGNRYNAGNYTCFDVINDLGYGCKIKFNFLNVEINFYSSMGLILSRNISDRLNVAYSFLNFLLQLSDKFKQLSDMKQDIENEKVKLERIRELESKSSQEWITTLMKNSQYPYRIEQTKAKILLHVKIAGKLQMSVPIYNKSFQKTIPEILETIKSYEDFIKESKSKGVQINSVPLKKNIVWENDK